MGLDISGFTVVKVNLIDNAKLLPDSNLYRRYGFHKEKKRLVVQCYPKTLARFHIGNLNSGESVRTAVPYLFYFADQFRNENSLADRSRPTIQKQKFVVLIPRLDRLKSNFLIAI